MYPGARQNRCFRLRLLALALMPRSSTRLQPAHRAVYGRRKLPARAQLPIREVVVTVLRYSIWPWLMPAALLVVVGLVVVDGAAGSIILACGFIALFGAGIKLISRNDPTPPQERRVPVGRDLPRPNQRSDSGI
jgi:hypothetical protein